MTTDTLEKEIVSVEPVNLSRGMARHRVLESRVATLTKVFLLEPYSGTWCFLLSLLVTSGYAFRV